MYYLFKEHPVSIKQTIDKSICVVCTYGKNKRINDISSLLNNTSSNEDTIHETQFMLKLLKAEQKNNVTICIPASILLYIVFFLYLPFQGIIRYYSFEKCVTKV